MKNAVEKSEVRLLAALLAGLLNGSVVAASLSDVHVLRDESRCAVEKCVRIFEGEMHDGVIHGAVVVAGGVNGSDVVASWGWADAAHTVPMTPSTVIDMASVTKTAAGVTAFTRAF